MSAKIETMSVSVIRLSKADMASAALRSHILEMIKETHGHDFAERFTFSERPPEQDTVVPPSPLFSRLFEARQVLLFGEVTMEKAFAVTAQLLALGSASSEPITLIVHSPGGHVESADTIFDMVRFLRAPVTTLGSGWVASAGALIFVAAPKERRLCLPNTRFLLHQPLGGVGGPATDVEIEARQIMLMRERLNRTFSEATGQPIEKVHKDTDRNYWLSAEEAVRYGLVDRVVTTSF